MSRWSDAYLRTLHDTMDTVDIVPPVAGAIGHSVNSVNSVTPPLTLPSAEADDAAEPGCNADPRAAEMAIILRDLQAACAMREAALIGAYETDEVIADREAIAAERLVPDPGTPERDRLDREQTEMVGGLLQRNTRGAVCKK
jgi:hypothetical protein